MASYTISTRAYTDEQGWETWRAVVSEADTVIDACCCYHPDERSALRHAAVRRRILALQDEEARLKHPPTYRRIITTNEESADGYPPSASEWTRRIEEEAHDYRACE